MVLHMILKPTFNQETFSTNLAKVGPVLVLLLHMLVELYVCGEFLFTFVALDHCATPSSVRAELTAIAELFSTKLTLEGFLSGVDAEVFDQHVFAS